MRKWMTCLLLLVATLSANAQFEKGKKFVGASLSGLNLSYSSSERFRFGVDAEAGYFLADCFMLKANVGYGHTEYTDDVRIGVGARYYFNQNGIYLGAGAEYNHFTPSNNDIMIPVEVGYAFFLNKHVTIEPAVYYKMSLHDFSDNSTVGLRIGFNYYF
ncbi:MAG: outer membrane beta-barrel protein [Bacteroidaceae bacterium]|nr:outer membrane beta-barrel protein [Bacteroidaceae bacterium]